MKLMIALLLVPFSLGCVSCTNITKEESAVWGALGGALIGSMIGHQSGESNAGAQLGATIGGLAGYSGGYAAERARIELEEEQLAASMAYQKELADLARLEESEARNQQELLDARLSQVVSEEDLGLIQTDLAIAEATIAAKQKEREVSLQRSRDLKAAQLRLSQAKARIEELESQQGLR